MDGHGPRQFSQTYGFIARNTSEEDEKSATAQAAAAAATAATAEMEAARGGRLLLPARTILAAVLIEAFALSLNWTLKGKLPNSIQ
jgi:hypothetical protein